MKRQCLHQIVKICFLFDNDIVISRIQSAYMRCMCVCVIKSYPASNATGFGQLFSVSLFHIDKLLPFPHILFCNKKYIVFLYNSVFLYTFWSIEIHKQNYCVRTIATGFNLYAIANILCTPNKIYNKWLYETEGNLVCSCRLASSIVYCRWYTYFKTVQFFCQNNLTPQSGGIG